MKKKVQIWIFSLFIFFINFSSFKPPPLQKDLTVNLNNLLQTTLKSVKNCESKANLKLKKKLLRNSG